MDRYKLNTVKVSRYQNYPVNGRVNFKHIGEDTFLGFVANCLNGGWLPESFWHTLRTEPDKSKRTELKTHIPAYTLSAYYKSGRKISENLVNHTGLFVADIDPGDNQHIANWPELRDAIFNAWQQVVLSCLSASGKGLFVVIALEGATPANHIKFFNVMDQAFKKISITIDQTCKDVGRFRFLSYDPELKYRSILQKEFSLPPEPKNKPIQQRNYKSYSSTTNDPYIIAVNAANKKYGLFCDGNKHNWINTCTLTLKSLGVSQIDRESFITNNFLDKSQINTNCIQ